MEESDSEEIVEVKHKSRSLFFDSDEDLETAGPIPSSFSRLFLSPAKSRPNSSYREKFLSPKVTSSRNISLVEGSMNNSSLVCSVCSVETDYSRDLGVEETSFQVN